MDKKLFAELQRSINEVNTVTEGKHKLLRMFEMNAGTRTRKRRRRTSSHKHTASR
jgi:hypothetical protein